MSKILPVLKTRKFWSDFLIMTVAMFVAAAGVNYFLLPSKIIVGSITGLSIVLTDIFASMGIEIRLSIIIFLINGLLLVLAYFLIGPEFGIKTVYTALILGPMLDVWEAILPAASLIEEGNTSIMNDPWFDLLGFVLILSISQAILFRINASTGGLDILAKIINKYLHFDIGTSVSVAGALICCTAFAINPFRLVVIGLIGTWINGIIVDRFTASLNRRKRVCIISDEHERIRDFIINKLKRGCSLYKVEGGYNGEQRIEIQAILATSEFSDLMAFIRNNDIRAFITAGNVSEVYGLWKTNAHGKESVQVLSQ